MIVYDGADSSDGDVAGDADHASLVGAVGPLIVLNPNFAEKRYSRRCLRTFFVKFLWFGRPWHRHHMSTISVVSSDAAPASELRVGLQALNTSETSAFYSRYCLGPAAVLLHRTGCRVWANSNRRSVINVDTFLLPNSCINVSIQVFT